MPWSSSPRLPWLLAVATGVPIAVLTGLGVWILKQDRATDRDRQQEALAIAAGRLALDVERALQSAEERLARGDGVSFTVSGPVAAGLAVLLYGAPAEVVPVIPADDSFRKAEALEYRTADLAAAADAYRGLAQSNNLALRGTALVGLGRVARKSGSSDTALTAYDELATLDSVVVDGQPAALVALLGRGGILEDMQDAVRLREHADRVIAQLWKGRWPIDRATFEASVDLARRWGATSTTPPADAVARTEAALRLWQTWRTGGLPARGRQTLTIEGAPLLAVWVPGPAGPTAWFGTPRDLESAFGPLAKTAGLTLSGHTNDGQLLFGAASSGTDDIDLGPSDTRLPFILSVDWVTPPAPGLSMRRLVLISSLGLAFLLMLGAAYGVYRATSREMALARQQTDFVSAVSHEFRTPLTSMRHLTDLLATRGVASEERRTHYYALLAQQTERLHRMVESLLSFGRIEAGAYAWQLATVDLAALLQGIVADFRNDPIAHGRTITCDVPNDLPAITADAPALSRAVVNLLENAAKYSAPGTPIEVSARGTADVVRVAVGDHGLGIPAAERERIFQKFVRGADAARAGIGGVGIGLALVRRIVEGHGGAVTVDSELGRGSTFTLELPISGLRQGH